MIRRLAGVPLWLWLELIICFGATAIRVPFSMFFLVHYLMSGLMFDPELQMRSRLIAIYGGTALAGLVAVWHVVAVRYRGGAPSKSPWLPALGVLIGLLTVAVFPEGRLPAVRLAEPDLLSELSCSVLPFLGFLHIAHLGRLLQFKQR